MDIETYLKSEAAREDVRALLKIPMNPAFQRGEDFDFESRPEKAWLRVEATRGHLVFVRCYVHRALRGSVVTDLGDGVRALRLKSGNWNTDLSDFEVSIDGKVIMLGDQVMHREDPDDANLPDAICRVMLASYKVANLDERGMG